jgi:hypothetical protein
MLRLVDQNDRVVPNYKMAPTPERRADPPGVTSTVWTPSKTFDPTMLNAIAKSSNPRAGSVLIQPAQTPQVSPCMRMFQPWLGSSVLIRRHLTLLPR